MGYAPTRPSTWRVCLVPPLRQVRENDSTGPAYVHFQASQNVVRPKMTAVTMVIRSRLRSMEVPPDNPPPPPNMSESPPPFPQGSSTNRLRNSEPARDTPRTAPLNTLR